jgi:N-acetylglucosaminyldiphosphoundecaprenol N-acetyl-beta-D-mannosaminyltransferase
MRVLRGAELVLPDGIGVKLALRMVGGKLRRNLNGTDLLPHLASLFIKREWPVFLLGATSEVLARAKANLARRHPGLVVAGVHDGYFKPADEAALCDEINASGAMVLLIGMGTPRQEQWAARNAPRLSVPLVLSMGGLLDFLGEKNRRAPLWMRQAGLEWVFRLLQEPRRMWRRYVIGNPVFLWRVRRWARSRPAPRKGR